MRLLLLSGLLLLSQLGLSACAHHRVREPQPVYGVQVLHGHVRAIEQFGDARYDRDARDVRGERSYREDRANSGAGAVVGGVVGGVIGNQVGRGSDRAAATVIGAVAGAVIGNEIERQENRREPGREARRDERHRGGARYRVWVQLRHGGEQAFDFDRLDGLRVGDPVRVVDGRLQRY